MFFDIGCRIIQCEVIKKKTIGQYRIDVETMCGDYSIFYTEIAEELETVWNRIIEIIKQNDSGNVFIDMQKLTNLQYKKGE